MLRRIPIRYSAPIVIAMPVLLVSAVLSWTWLGQSRAAVRDLANQNLSQIHDRVRRHLADLLSVPARLDRINLDLIRRGILDPDRLMDWLPAMREQALAFDMLSSITYGDERGRAVWFARYADGHYYFAVKQESNEGPMLEYRVSEDSTIPDIPTSQFAFDPRVRPWYRAPMDADAPAWGDPFVWVGGADAEESTLGISYGVPLRNEQGKAIAVVDADLSLNDISKFLETLSIGKSGIAYITDVKGLLIATSADTPVTTPGGERIASVSSGDPRIATAAQLLATEAGERFLDSVPIEGAPHLVRASVAGEEAGVRWTLVTIVPELDFTAGIDAGFRRSIGVTILGVLGAVALGITAGVLLVRPLLRLVTYVRRIGQGDLDTRVQLVQSPEFKHLSTEINAMTTGLKDRIRMRESLSLAMEVQQNLLPSSSPRIEGLDIAGHSTYCDETGGDYYDYLDISGADASTAVIALGDVMGHGVAAAMLMATARGILRSRCETPGSLSEMLEHLNALLVEDTGGYRFMTMLLMTVCARRSELRWCSAGHGAPILYDPGSDSFASLPGAGIPLGIGSDASYSEHRFADIGRGQVIVAATDGLWETRSESGALFGMVRLEELIRRNARGTAEEMSEAIRDALARFRGSSAQDDDLTFVVIKVVD